jgi:hypothetical protein
LGDAFSHLDSWHKDCIDIRLEIKQCLPAQRQRFPQAATPTPTSRFHDDRMKYGRDMMRYVFHEMGMPGGTNKYPGYYSYLSDATIKKLNAEQESFIKATEDLRQTIYEKELYLNAELVKKAPDTAIALSLQNIISETRGKFEQQMIEHIIRMKKINLEAERK